MTNTVRGQACRGRGAQGTRAPAALCLDIAAATSVGESARRRESKFQALYKEDEKKEEKKKEKNSVGIEADGSTSRGTFGHDTRVSSMLRAEEAGERKTN